jgi:molecular chaperone HtpG
VANRSRIAKLLRFASTHSDSEAQTVSLADYVGRMQPGQDTIYYVTAETFLAAKNSPHLEIFRRRGIEVLLLYERIDEWLVANLTEYDGRRLASIARGELDLSSVQSDAKEPDWKVGEHAELLRALKGALGERVKDVRLSRRLTESPSCLVADEHDLGGNLARILRAAGQKVPALRPILELNPTHPIVLRLKPADERFADWAALLYEQALLAEGGSLEDPAGYVKRANSLMLGLVTN